MSYTPPLGTAANFDFTGDAYTAPPANGVNFTWDTLSVTKTATGFCSTAFGAPTSAYWRIEQTTGFLATTFGNTTHGRGQLATGIAPTVTFWTPKTSRGGTASGFQSTTFGTPASKIEWLVTKFGTPRLFPMHVAPGAVITQFGTPEVTQRWKVLPWLPETRFGTPSTATNRTGVAYGTCTTSFGYPWGISSPPPNLTQVLQAYGNVTTEFGTPRAAQQQFAAPVGFVTGAFGVPTSRTTQSASGFTVAAFGTPVALAGTRATGFCSTVFGVPHSARFLQSTSPPVSTRFGTPLAVRSRTYLATGSCTTRFGYPTGFLRFNKQAFGFCSTSFGSPASRVNHRATMLAPTTAFGTPLLKRILQC